MPCAHLSPRLDGGKFEYTPSPDPTPHLTFHRTRARALILEEILVLLPSPPSTQEKGQMSSPKKSFRRRAGKKPPASSINTSFVLVLHPTPRCVARLCLRGVRPHRRCQGLDGDQAGRQTRQGASRRRRPLLCEKKRRRGLEGRAGLNKTEKAQRFDLRCSWAEGAKGVPPPFLKAHSNPETYILILPIAHSVLLRLWFDNQCLEQVMRYCGWQLASDFLVRRSLKEEESIRTEYYRPTKRERLLLLVPGF